MSEWLDKIKKSKKMPVKQVPKGEKAAPKPKASMTMEKLRAHAKKIIGG